MSQFYTQPLPEVWREILSEKVPYIIDLLDYPKYLLPISHTYLAGGLLRAFVEDAQLASSNTDIDLFFSDSYTYNAVKDYLVNIDSDIEKIFQCPEDKLATFLDKSTGWQYQCIAVDFYESLEEVVSSFDFTCICIGTDGQNLIFREDTMSDILEKNLRWNKITYPASSLRRMMKYSRKGYKMSESEYQFFVEQVYNHSDTIVDGTLVYVD